MGIYNSLSDILVSYSESPVNVSVLGSNILVSYSESPVNVSVSGSNILVSYSESPVNVTVSWSNILVSDIAAMSCYLFVTSVVCHLLCQLHSQWSPPAGCLHSSCVGPRRIWTLVSSCLQNVQMGVPLMAIWQGNIYPVMDPRHRLENIHQRVGWTAWGAVVPCLAAWAQFVFLFERASTWSVRIGNRRRAEFYVYIFVDM